MAGDGVSKAEVNWYTGRVVALGVLVLAQALWELPSTPEPQAWLTLGILAVAATTFSMKLPGVSAHLSISDAFFFTSAVLYGPAPATISIAVDSLLMSWRQGHRRQQVLFNTTSNALALWAAAQIYAAFSQQPRSGSVFSADLLIPLVASAAVYFLLNTALTCTAIALTRGIAVVPLWRLHFASLWVNYFSAASASVALMVLIREVGIVGIAPILPFIYVGYIAMRSNVGRLKDAETHLARVNALYLSTVTAFASAIEAKDGVTSSHIHRVRAYVMELARTLGVTDHATLQALEAAALLHDTGKLAVPEHILNKPGKLTTHEFATMKMHVEVGAGILSAIDFPFPVVPIVMAHHENWDGSGYPLGLKGEAIPLGARILSVADCYDALTSDRPYRRAMSDEMAVQHILGKRGAMYDPAVVDAFKTMDREIPVHVPKPALQAALTQISAHGSGVHVAARSSPALKRETGVNAPTRIGRNAGGVTDALASLARLGSDLAHARDVTVIAATIVRAAFPSALVALYSVDVRHGALSVRVAAGDTDGLVSGLKIAVGERLSGWVAANRRVMVNGQTELDSVELAGTGLRHATCIPVTLEDDVTGVLTAYTPSPLSDAEVAYLESLAHQVALTVKTAAAIDGGRRAEAPRHGPARGAQGSSKADAALRPRLLARA